jgi:hypothetical protein
MYIYIYRCDIKFMYLLNMLFRFSFCRHFRAKSENDLVYFEVEEPTFKFPDAAIVAKPSAFDPIVPSDVEVKFKNNSCVIQ